MSNWAVAYRRWCAAFDSAWWYVKKDRPAPRDTWVPAVTEHPSPAFLVIWINGREEESEESFRFGHCAAEADYFAVRWMIQRRRSSSGLECHAVYRGVWDEAAQGLWVWRGFRLDERFIYDPATRRSRPFHPRTALTAKDTAKDAAIPVANQLHTRND